MSKKLVPDCNDALSKFKNEVAKELGIHFTDYNGHLTARECGSVGGEMVKKMVESYEKNLRD
ncbi:MAG: alpha/beta-type small acid-soluble spore protein [Sarcina sp.]